MNKKQVVIFLAYFVVIICGSGFYATVHGQDFRWSKAIGSTLDQICHGVAVDSSSNVFITGEFQGSVDFGGGLLSSAGGRDIFLAKYTSQGDYQWALSFGDASEQISYSVAVDSTGNVLITGSFQGSLDFGGDVLTSVGSTDIYLAKFNAAGSHVWSKSFGDASAQIGYSLATDNNNNIIITGNFAGSVDFGGGLLMSAGGTDIFLARFGPTSMHHFSTSFGDSTNQNAYCVAVDGSNNIYLTGSFLGTVNFGGTNLISAGSQDVYLVRFNSVGSHVWSKSFGSTLNQIGNAVDIDTAGNCVVTGLFFGSINFGGGIMTSAGSSDIFLARFAADSSFLWSKSFGDASAQGGKSVAVDNAGNSLITGYMLGCVDFGGGILTGAGLRDIFLAAYDSEGDHLQSQIFGDNSNQEALSITISTTGTVYQAGKFEGSVDFGGGTHSSAGTADIFLVSYTPVSVPALGYAGIVLLLVLIGCLLNRFMH